MIHAEGLRSQLAEILDTAISDVLWAYWIEQGYIQRILTGELSLNSAVLELRRALAAYREQPGYGERVVHAYRLAPRSPAAADTSVRDPRFEDLVAWAADRDPEVQAFRTEVLSDRRVPDETEALDTWLNAHEDAERAMDIWIKDVRISPAERTALRTAIQAAFAPATPDGLQPEQPPTVTVHLPVAQFPWQLSLRLLHCRVSEWGFVRHLPVTEGEVLDRLRVLAAYLAPRYGWDEADAANFVLTGAPQPTPRISSEVTLAEPLSAMSRITLTIDPSTKSSVVARYYEDLRFEVTRARSRELSEKHLELAHFTAGRPEDETWGQRMEMWNRRYPQFAYEHERNFARDALQAQKRLLHPDYRAPGSPGRPRTVKHIRS